MPAFFVRNIFSPLQKFMIFYPLAKMYKCSYYKFKG